MSCRFTTSVISAVGAAVALTLPPVPAVASAEMGSPRVDLGVHQADPLGRGESATAWDEPRPSVDAPPKSLVAEAKAAGRLKFAITREVDGRLEVDTAKAASAAAAKELVAALQDAEGTISIEPAVGGARILADHAAPAADEGAAPVQASDDPFRWTQWALDTLVGESVWDVTTGDNVVVAVIDTGVSEHVDLAESRILPGADFSWQGGDGRNDGHGHGTHVAGIVAATLNNSTGIAGLAPDADILPVKVLADDGYGSWWGIADGIRWATDHGADVVNLSLGGSTYSETLAVATQYALDHDVAVLAAAGNSRTQGSPISYPAAYPGVVGVAATDSANNYASFSNAGDYVDVSAPGVSIMSTLPGDDYNSWSGTSMATPYAAAAAALVRARAEALGRVLPQSGVAQLLQTTALDLGTTGRDNDYGHGLIRPLEALTTLAHLVTPPPAPSGLAAQPADRSAVVRFTAPAQTGGAPITNYQYSVDGGVTWISRTPTSPASPVTITGLGNGRTYSIRLRAVNEAGAGTPSPAVSVTPRTVPGAPPGLRVTGYPGAGQAALAWNVPSNGGAAISGYRLRVSRPNSTMAFDPWRPVGRTSAVLSGRTRGARYVVQVVAVNVAGNSPAASLPFTQANVPVAVTNVRMTFPAAGRANIRWTPGGNGGSAITAYRIRIHRIGAVWGPWTSAATPAKAYSELRRDATYEVQIVAVNSQGQSPVRTARFAQSL